MAVSLTENPNTSGTRRLRESNYFPGRYQLMDNGIPVIGSLSENQCASEVNDIPPSSAVESDSAAPTEIPQVTTSSPSVSTSTVSVIPISERSQIHDLAQTKLENNGVSENSSEVDFVEILDSDSESAPEVQLAEEDAKSALLWTCYDRKKTRGIYYFHKGKRLQEFTLHCKKDGCKQTKDMSSQHGGRGNLWKHLNTHGIYNNNYEDTPESIAQLKKDLDNPAKKIPKKVRKMGRLSIEDQLRAAPYQIELQFFKFCISANMAFTVIENAELRRLLKMLKAPLSIQVMSRRTLTNRIQGIAAQEQDKLKNILADVTSISLTFDIWTSVNQVPYLCVFFHGSTNEFKYIEGLLGFIECGTDHRGINLADQIYKLMKQYNILGKLIAVCADSASNNNTLTQELQRKIHMFCETTGGSQLSELFSFETCQLRCFAHSINLWVCDIVENLRDGEYVDDYDAQEGFNSETTNPADIAEDRNIEVAVDGTYTIVGQKYQTDPVLSSQSPISKIRKLLNILKYSPKLQELLKREFENPNDFRSVVLDVRTRWNSLNNMLQYALKFQGELSRLSLNIQNMSYEDQRPTCMKYSSLFAALALTNKEWHLMKVTASILNFFSEISDKFSAAKSNTESILNTYYLIDDFFAALLGEDQEVREDLFNDLGIIEDIKKNGGALPQSLVIGLKKGWLKLKKYYDIADKSDIVYIATLLDPRLNRGFLIEHLGLDVATDIIHAITHTLKKYHKVISSKKRDVEVVTKVIKKRAKVGWRKKGGTSTEVEVIGGLEEELERHMKLPPLGGDMELDVLAYWKQCSATFPILSQLAKIFMAIPSTSVSTERCFASARGLLGLRRHSMSPQMLSSLLFLKCNGYVE
jgi:hypothetical protein